jgi:hypothetical protein
MKIIWTPQTKRQKECNHDFPFDSLIHWFDKKNRAVTSCICKLTLCRTVRPSRRLKIVLRDELQQSTTKSAVVVDQMTLIFIESGERKTYLAQNIFTEGQEVIFLSNGVQLRKDINLLKMVRWNE